MGHSASSSEQKGRILLVGDIEEVFLDAQSVARYPCDVCTGLLDGIEAAALGDHDAVAVVMSGVGARLQATLKALRKGTGAPIFLLAMMYEEPVARSLVCDEETSSEGRDLQCMPLADRYLVCPLSLAGFFEEVSRCSPQVAHVPSEAEPPVSSDALAARIRRLEWLATTDDLTGLKNRRYIHEFARQTLDRAREDGGRVTLLVFDIDNFKHYNDVYGHLAGDEILRQAALLMRRSCRPHDVVGRIGGDEFVVLFWDDPRRVAPSSSLERRSKDSDHPTEAISVARRFQAALGRADLHLLGPAGEGLLTISGGLASFPRDASTVEDLFRCADEALLEAKRSGKNRIYLVGRPQSDIANM
jgi:diguanylate cyclase (GGDEF)-like protein